MVSLLRLLCLVGVYYQTSVVFASSPPTLANLDYAILGPFASSGNHFGGADPLEAFGGIWNLRANDQSTFLSELVVGGKVHWTNVTSGNKHLAKCFGNLAISADVDGIVNYDYIDLDVVPLMLGLGLGSIENFRSWGVASFYIKETGTYLISCGNVESYFVDDREFIGDPYALRSWWGQNGWFWLPINLTEGSFRPITH